MTREKLDKVLENHLHWLNRDCEGWESMKADLRGANLMGANLKGANLREADLKGANLWEANLREADLREADLRGANLKGANLREANLREADLRGANLREADLKEANLRGANLREANLREADLKEANLEGAKDIPYVPLACPDTGSFIGWKKAQGLIVCLEIPADAKRSSATTRKCRCDKAKVLSISKLNGADSGLNEISSNYDFKFIYRIGETVSVDDFCEDRFNECAPGIHFFINRQDAVNY